MAISYQVLGKPTRDNALIVTIDSGQSIQKLLFDCGEGCLNTIPLAEIHSVNHLFFSHLHMDHIGGFDSYFRCNFNRQDLPNHIWGPPDTSTILQRRFQGFLWNLHAQMDASWFVHDILTENVQTTRYELKEAFTKPYVEKTVAYNDVVLQCSNFKISAFTMDHQTPTIAYFIKENPKNNIDNKRLQELGFKPGPWIKELKDFGSSKEKIEINGETHSLKELRKQLLVETQGSSIAYLTDFLLDEDIIAELAPKLQKCQTIVCEAQYKHEDIALAQKNHHMTVKLSAQLAHRAKAGELILFHISDRYKKEQWKEILGQAREIFEKTSFPQQWDIN